MKQPETREEMEAWLLEHFDIEPYKPGELLSMASEFFTPEDKEYKYYQELYPNLMSGIEDENEIDGLITEQFTSLFDRYNRSRAVEPSPELLKIWENNPEFRQEYFARSKNFQIMANTIAEATTDERDRYMEFFALAAERTNK